jgi:hypothetical protein
MALEISKVTNGKNETYALYLKLVVSIFSIYTCIYTLKICLDIDVSKQIWDK